MAIDWVALLLTDYGDAIVACRTRNDQRSVTDIVRELRDEHDALKAEAKKLQRQFCEAHQPTDLDADTTCPCCEATHQAVEVEWLRKWFPVYARHNHVCLRAGSLADMCQYSAIKSEADRRRCTCGLSEVLAEPEGKP